MMKIFLLLLSLMAGCEASTEVKVCRDGWVEFYCKYKASETYQIIDVVPPNNSEIRSTQKDQWENKGRYSLYHDTKNKRLKVAIKQLQQENFGEYECEFFQDQNSPDEVEDEVKVAAETDGCQGQFNQTVYRTAKTTITCDYPENKHRFSDKFLCRENKFTCEEILSTSSSVKSNRKYNLTETNRGFSVSISNVSSHDAGLYWCGVNEGNYRTGLRKIQLKVEGGSQVVITLVVCVAVLLLLLFVIILILIYKRCSHSKHRRNGAAEHTREDYVYEEVQDYVQKPDSGNAVTTIYATANFPTNPSASLHHSTIN
ncbi:polymeric immunoglobulin receptor-like isoform X14 [Dicentrarchus labrax]|uniref:polymeric immunoglobulin receptor-like isoform X14 n=1 Tax=Dicentrarchus labrax TaxID=13489 RepID=UPI0021F5AB85|nr:polymeric immunoglobulin receptor-like isoform X14 [Dicentrarchus labrax]